MVLNFVLTQFYQIKLSKLTTAENLVTYCNKIDNIPRLRIQKLYLNFGLRSLPMPF